MKVLGIETREGRVYHYDTEDHLTDPNITISRDCIVLESVGNYEVICHPMNTICRWWVVDKKNVAPHYRNCYPE